MPVFGAKEFFVAVWHLVVDTKRMLQKASLWPLAKFIVHDALCCITQQLVVSQSYSVALVLCFPNDYVTIHTVLVQRYDGQAGLRCNLRVHGGTPVWRHMPVYGAESIGISQTHTVNAGVAAYIYIW